MARVANRHRMQLLVQGGARQRLQQFLKRWLPLAGGIAGKRREVVAGRGPHGLLIGVKKRVKRALPAFC
jgi:hypothetical protein